MAFMAVMLPLHPRTLLCILGHVSWNAYRTARGRRPSRLQCGIAEGWGFSLGDPVFETRSAPRTKDAHVRYGEAVTFRRTKRRAAAVVMKLSRTFSVVASLMSTVVLAALKESGWPVRSVPALCAS